MGATPQYIFFEILKPPLEIVAHPTRLQKRNCPCILEAASAQNPY